MSVKEEKMSVRLMDHTVSGEKLAAAAAWNCHRKDIPFSENISEKKKKEILKATLESGHEGVIEHVKFTFAIENVSRVLTHQLVRHRLASFDQQSQREVDLENAGFIIPQEIKNSKFEEEFKEKLEELLEFYEKMQDAGINNEYARFILPNATATNIVMTMNARSLRHFLKLRTCNRAQNEIQELAFKILKKCREISPTIFNDAGPPCATKGECPEAKRFSCGDPYTKEDVKEKINEL